MRPLAQEQFVEDPLSRSAVSATRKKLIVLLHRLNFGRIENLRVVHGEPVLTPQPRVVRKFKLGGDNGPRAERHTGDFVLKAPIVELFRQFDRIVDGFIPVIQVANGLPLSLEVEEEFA